MCYPEILEKIAAAYRGILRENLIGIYVHGSVAFGCFRWEKSDLDFLVVVEEPPALPEKMALIQTLLDLKGVGPPKGFEMSVVLEKVCRDFVYPTPFELHYSDMHLESCQNNLENYCRSMHGTDRDLAAHFTVTKAVGYPLCGKAVEQVFGEVPKADYLDSIRADVEDAPQEVLGNPVYIILNLCRVYAYMRDGLILSKEQGGRWGIGHLPASYHPVIQAALDDYCSDQGFFADKDAVLRFAQDMKTKIGPIL